MFICPKKRSGQYHRKKVVNITGTGGQDGLEYTAKAYSTMTLYNFRAELRYIAYYKLLSSKQLT